MMNNLKMGMKLLRYTYGTGISVGLSIVFLIVGIAIYFVMPAGWFAGGFFLMAVGMWPLQMLFSMVVPDIVQTSPWKKALQIKVLPRVGIACMSVTNIIVFLLNLITLSQNPRLEDTMSAVMLYTGICAMLLLCYMAGALKYFNLSTVIFLVLYLVIMWSDGFFSTLINLEIPYPLAVIISFGLIWLGGALSHVMYCLLYRRPVAKGSQMNGLKKMM